MSDALRTAASRPATLEDVARVAGVSRSTVSRVINGIRNVDLEIQETVREAIAATGYVPNSAARSLVTRRAGSIALVLSGVAGMRWRTRTAPGTGSSPTPSSAAPSAVWWVRCARADCTRC